MKLERKKNTTASSGVVDTNKANINEKNIDIAFQDIIKYSNPVSSVVREITSNAVDANNETGEDHSVDITYDHSDINQNIMLKFRDYGYGISPEKFENVYMSLYESDKRDSNDHIGAFGIGSKSSLSVADNYYVRTIHEGVCYLYLVWNDGVYINSTLMDEFETSEHQGTEIQVPVDKISYNVLLEALRDQLAFFRNIRIHGMGMEPNKIVEGENFIVSTWSQKPSICLGCVKYNIDFDSIKQYDEDDFMEDSLRGLLKNSNVGLKFDIGELGVTSKREGIKYNKESAKLILERARKVKDELRELNKKRLEEINDLPTYLSQLMDNFLSNDTSIVLGEVEVRSGMPLKRLTVEGERGRIVSDLNIESSFRTKDIIKDFSSYRIDHYNFKSYNTDTSFRTVLRKFLAGEIDLVVAEGRPDSIRKNFSIEQRKYLEWGYILELPFNREYEHLVHNGDHKEFQEFLKLLKEDLINKGAIDYNEITPTQEEEELRKSMKEQMSLEEYKRSITYREAVYVSEKGIEFRECKDINRIFPKQTVIYGFQKDRDKLLFLASILAVLGKDRNYQVISLAKKNTKYLEDLENPIMYCDEVLKKESRFLQEYFFMKAVKDDLLIKNFIGNATHQVPTDIFYRWGDKSNLSDWLKDKVNSIEEKLRYFHVIFRRIGNKRETFVQIQEMISKKKVVLRAGGLLDQSYKEGQKYAEKVLGEYFKYWPLFRFMSGNLSCSLGSAIKERTFRNILEDSRYADIDPGLFCRFVEHQKLTDNAE